MKQISWFPLTLSVTLHTPRDERSFSWISDRMRWHWPSQPQLISELTAVSCCVGKVERLRDDSCVKNKRDDNTNCTAHQAQPPMSLNTQEWEGASLHGNCRSKIIGHGPDCAEWCTEEELFFPLFFGFVPNSSFIWAMHISQLCPTWLD